jgi:microcystin-dependent protein
MAERFEYSGHASPATLGGDISASDMNVTINTAEGWPTGGTGKFHFAIDPGLSNEEKITALSRSGTSLTVFERGVDGTVAQSHGIGAEVRHVFTAIDIDLVNQHAADPALDDHSQYVHNSIARTVSADHTYTGDSVHEGEEIFNGDTVFGGSTTFIESPTMPMGSAVPPVLTVAPGTAGTSPVPMRSDARAQISKSDVLRAMYDVGDFKLTSVTGAVDTTEWLECNGATFSLSTYPALGVLYPTGILPDFRDKVLSGAAANAVRQIRATGGSDMTTITATNLPGHTHGINDPGHAHAIVDPGHKHGIDGDVGARVIVTAPSTMWLAGSGVQEVSISDVDSSFTNITATQANTTNITTQSAGGQQPFSTVPAWIGVRVLIKAS